MVAVHCGAMSAAEAAANFAAGQSAYVTDHDPLGHGTHGTEHAERFEEVSVGGLELAVRLEQEMVPHPHRLEPERLGPSSAVEDLGQIAVLAEVREEEPELHRHEGTTILPWPGSPTTAPSAYTSRPRTSVRSTAPVIDRP